MKNICKASVRKHTYVVEERAVFLKEWFDISGKFYLSAFFLRELDARHEATDLGYSKSSCFESLNSKLS